MMKRKAFFLVAICIATGITIASVSILEHTWRVVSEDSVSGGGLGAGGRGIAAVTTIWRSMSGTLIDEFRVRYSSSEEAQKDFEEELKGDGTIIEREKNPENFPEVDERFVKVFGNPKTREGAARIVRLENECIISIEVGSLEYALAFENGWLKLEF